MCQRNSVQSQSSPNRYQNKQQKIKSLVYQVNHLQYQITQKDKIIFQLSQIKQNVKKIPYNIYKEFLITTQTDGSVVNLVKKKSMELQRYTFGQPSNKNSQKPYNYEQYLLIKLKGDKPSIYVSTNTQISTIEKINLSKAIQQERQSYSYVSPDLQVKSSVKTNFNLKLNKKVIEYKINQMNKNKKAQLNNQQKKLLMFPPSSSNMPKQAPQLKRKQSFPLKMQCQILSDDIKKLKQKIFTYTKIVQQKSNNLTSIQNSLIVNKRQQKFNEQNKNQINNNNQTNNKKQENKNDDITQFIESKIKQVSPIDFDGLLESKWKKQKQQYIDYISNLQKELKQLKKSQLSSNFIVNNGVNNNKSKQYINNTPSQSQIRSVGLFDTPISQLRTNKQLNKNQKYSIFKSDPQQVHKSYHKNQYHINENQKSRSKSKSSKIIYLRR